MRSPYKRSWMVWSAFHNNDGWALGYRNGLVVISMSRFSERKICHPLALTVVRILKLFGRFHISRGRVSAVYIAIHRFFIKLRAGLHSEGTGFSLSGFLYRNTFYLYTFTGYVKNHEILCKLLCMQHFKRLYKTLCNNV